MAACFPSLILLMVFSIRLVHAGPRTDIVALTCTNPTVAHDDRYFDYYNKIIPTMLVDMGRNKFGYMTYGRPPDQIFVLSQCMDDLTSSECCVCFSEISDLLAGCFPSTGGRVYLDGCLIIADNYSFSENVISPSDMKRCSTDNHTTPEFRDLVRQVIMDIIDRAPRSNGFMLHHKTYNATTVFGVGSCLKTLDTDSCSMCLKDGALSALSCLPSKEGHALNAGCILRYSNYEFYNDHDTLAVEGAIISYISCILAAVAVCLLAVAFGFCVGKITYRHKNRKRKPKGKEDLEMHKSLRFMQFKHTTLEKATENFSEANKLGTGGYGEVYKGTLPDGREIAIKRLFVSGKSRLEEIYNEMDIINGAQHKNLVRFLGCCFSNMNCFLVYEYLANKSLDRILFDPEKKKELNWDKRFGIILGTAEGLVYLHEDCQVRIVHRDIKSSNILLDSKYKPKIADFGLARFFSSEEPAISPAIVGTLGYMAPEYIARGRLTDKVDVYSFGILVLEIVSGVQNNKFQSEDSLETLVIHTWKHFQSDTIAEIIDKSMENLDIKEITRVIQVGLLCTQELPYLRPTMTNVIGMLKQKDFNLPIPTRPPFTEESVEFSPFGSNRLLSCTSDSLLPSDN